MNISPDRIIAYFQPILSADTKEIYAYEVLGRYLDNEGTVQSLGPFFTSPDTSPEEALKVDRIVRRYAIKKYAEEKRNEYLFINIRLAWLMSYASKPEEMVTLQLIKEFGIAPDKLVIEITEEEFNTNEEYIHAIIYYKKIGCRIALDDYGKNASNIDRLAKLKPDIIKINIDYIHNSERSYYYHEYLRFLTIFADSVGIEVLYEGVETQKQLDICTSLNGRYYQGFIIARPQPSMHDAVVNDTVFSISIENAQMVLQNEIIKTEALRKFLDAKVACFLTENPFDYGETNYGAYLIKFCKELSNARLVFLCDRHGNQLSYNVSLLATDINPNNYERLTIYKNKNWAWRKYFRKALKFFAIGQKSCISSVYNDFATKDRIRTYSYAISDDVLLFVDITTDMERTDAYAAR